MNRGDGDVERVGTRLQWKASRRKEVPAERNGLFRGVKDRSLAQRGQPALRSLGVSAAASSRTNWEM